MRVGTIEATHVVARAEVCTQGIPVRNWVTLYACVISAIAVISATVRNLEMQLVYIGI